jgi:hypothetical protein
LPNSPTETCMGRKTKSFRGADDVQTGTLI